MRIEKRIIYKYIILINTFIISYIMIAFCDAIIIHIMSMLLLSIVASCLVGFDLMHPFFWFSAFFAIYSVGYPLILSMGFSSRIGYSKETMIYQLVALFTLLLVVTPKRISARKKEKIHEVRFNIGILNRLIYIALVVLIMLTGIYVAEAGFSGKGEIYESGGIILNMLFRFPLILAFLYTLSLISQYAQTRKLPVKQMAFTGVALIFLTLFSGERDFIFRFLLLTVFVLWIFEVINIKKLFIIAPVFSLLLPLSSAYKYFFLNGNVFAMNENVLYSFLTGEFESAARNLQLLINNSSAVKGCKGLAFIFSDIVSVFYSEIDSASAWFDQTFYSNSTTEYGFTLVGEGYIMGGMGGIIFLFILIGLLIRVFYRNAYKNVYTLSSYLYFITVIIYAIRCDFGLILSAVIKQIGFVVLILWMAENVSKKEQRV